MGWPDHAAALELDFVPKQGTPAMHKQCASRKDMQIELLVLLVLCNCLLCGVCENCGNHQIVKM